MTPFDFQSEGYLKLDFTAKNPALAAVNFEDVQEFHDFVFGLLSEEGVKVGIGGWLEKRIIYNNRKHFQGENQRCFHLGADIWAEANTPIFAIENCRIHSFKNNAQNGDYGPTIVLQSISSNLYYLFGHLSLDSLKGLKIGSIIEKGQGFARIGNFSENGNWPPHVHFQVMNSMEGLEGDFPGVCSEKDLAHYKTICISPYSFLGIDEFQEKVI